MGLREKMARVVWETNMERGRREFLLGKLPALGRYIIG